MSVRVKRKASMLGQSFMVFFAVTFSVYPAFYALAEGADGLPPASDVLHDVLVVLAFAAVIAEVVEAIRFMFEPLARGADTSDGAKFAIRMLSLSLGIGAGLYGLAPGIMDGSNPHLVGGIASGAVASTLGHLIVKYVNLAAVSALKGIVSEIKRRFGGETKGSDQ